MTTLHETPAPVEYAHVPASSTPASCSTSRAKKTLAPKPRRLRTTHDHNLMTHNNQHLLSRCLAMSESL